MSCIVGKNLEEINFVRENSVKSLRGLKSKEKIGNEEIPVNPEMLFRRIALLQKSDTELQNYLKPYTLPLFNECSMRISSKSVLYDHPNNCQNQLSGYSLRY
ncbi:hypothetical protein AVEN_118784-1 [Araneus ventricosus]|uniref:Uncharacterized protein n=1 Tax=Araneus ventricosus TaxID=182803 RepID=A0A4Y2BVG3_ARAVE|nr:hypothetical protein AVEN_118784-1 [Araneus ventricosus]